MINVQKKWQYIKTNFLSEIEDTVSNFTHLAVGMRLPCNLTRMLPEGQGFSQSKWFKKRIVALKTDTIVCLFLDVRNADTVTFSHAVGLTVWYGRTLYSECMPGGMDLWDVGDALRAHCLWSLWYPSYGSVVKTLPAMQETQVDPWNGKIPWRRKRQLTPVFLPGKSHGQRSLVGYSPWGRKESDMTKQLHFHFLLFSF